MLLKEKASHWLYLPVAIMLVMMLLTQSRGPLIAPVLAVGCTLHLHVFTRRNLLIAAALAVLVALLLVMTPVGDMLLARFEELGTQSGLRLSIWHHTLSEMASQPGWDAVSAMNWISSTTAANTSPPPTAYIWARC